MVRLLFLSLLLCSILLVALSHERHHNHSHQKKNVYKIEASKKSRYNLGGCYKKGVTEGLVKEKRLVEF